MSSSDFFRKFQPLFEAKTTGTQKLTPEEEAEHKEQKPKVDAKMKEMSKDTKAKETKKASNVKETAGDFFRKYADLITEAEEDDEDPDVAAADKVKGKDGKTQKDAEKGKKLPPWLDKKDKEDEDKGAKKAKKDKDI